MEMRKGQINQDQIKKLVKNMTAELAQLYMLIWLHGEISEQCPLTIDTLAEQTYSKHSVAHTRKLVKKLSEQKLIRTQLISKNGVRTMCITNIFNL